MRFLRCALPGLAALAAAAWLAQPAAAAPRALAGIKDDAWLLYGPGTLSSRVAELDAVGVDVVRFTLRWDDVAPDRPRDLRDPAAYRWGVPARVVDALRARGIDTVLTLVGTPGWANGGAGPSVAPDRCAFFAGFAHAAALRFPWVRRWTVWNEPNQRRWLDPASPGLYVRRLLNPARAAIKEAIPQALVAGGMTAPRANAGGVSPLAWVRGMGEAGAQLDAYAHHPYPLRPQAETPWSGGCAHCETVSMASLERLMTAVRKAFGDTRIWLTEYGYQTNPPDRWLGVSPQLQARYTAEAAYRVWAAPRVDMLINFLYQDDVPDRGVQSGWQSGLKTSSGLDKPARRAFMLPLVLAGNGAREATLWGQVRPRSGSQPYRLQRRVAGDWEWVGGTRLTSPSGTFVRRLPAQPGTSFRFWSPRDGVYSLSVTVR